MLANFLEKSKPINFIAFLSFFLMFFLILFIKQVYYSGFSLTVTINGLISCLAILLIFFFYQFITKKNKLTLNNSYTYYIFTISIVAFLNELLNLEFLLPSIVYLLLIRRLYSLNLNKNTIQKLFDAGFWLSVLFITNSYAIIFYSLIITSIIINKQTSIRTLLTPVIGFSVPLIMYFCYALYNDNLQIFYSKFNFIKNVNLKLATESKYLIGFIIICSICFISFIVKSPSALSVSNSFKKKWLLLGTNALVTALYFLGTINRNGSEIIFFLIPFSVIIANGIQIPKKTIFKDIVLTILTLISIAGFFFY